MRRLTLLCMVFLLAARLAEAQDFISQPKLKWKFKAGPVYGSPVVDKNLVFVASADSSLRALELESGKEKWRLQLYGASRATPYVHGESVFILAEDGLLYNVSKATGKVLWHHATPQATLSERKYDRADYFQSSPVVHDDRVFFGMGDYLYAVNLTDGSLAWSFQTGNLVHTKPAISGEKLVFGSYDGYVYALNRTNGALIWKFKTVGHRFFPNGEVMGNPVITKNLVLVGARDYNIYAIDLHGGYCHWNKQFPRGWALSATVYQDSVLYLGTSDDYLMIALNPRSGTEAWRASLKYNIFGGMAVGNSMGYVGTLIGKLYGIDLKRGEVKWAFEGEGYRTNREKYFDDNDQHLQTALAKFGNFDEVLKMYRDMGAIFSTPALTASAIVVAAADGHVYCLSR